MATRYRLEEFLMNLGARQTEGAGDMWLYKDKTIEIIGDDNDDCVLDIRPEYDNEVTEPVEEDDTDPSWGEQPYAQDFWGINLNVEK
jgi:hypothetical protein